MTLIWVALVGTFALVAVVTVALGRRSTAFRDNQALRDAAADHDRADRARATRPADDLD